MADMGIISNFQSDENGKRAVRKRAKPKKKKIFLTLSRKKFCFKCVQNPSRGL